MVRVSLGLGFLDFGLGTSFETNSHRFLSVFQNDHLLIHYWTDVNYFLLVLQKLRRVHKFDLKTAMWFFYTSKQCRIDLAHGPSWLDLARQSVLDWLNLAHSLHHFIHHYTSLREYLASLRFDCNERFSPRNSNELIVCSNRIHSERQQNAFSFHLQAFCLWHRDWIPKLK